MKQILTLLLSFTLFACNSGGSGNTGKVFPYQDHITFNLQTNDNIIALSDKSLWFITGVYYDGDDIIGESDITIYENTGDFDAPTAGEQGNYFMEMTSFNGGYYLDALTSWSLLGNEDDFTFSNQRLGDLLAFADGSIWTIVGTETESIQLKGEHDLTSYKTSLLPDMTIYGVQSAYYLYLSDAADGIYMEPVSGITRINSDTMNLANPGLGDYLVINGTGYFVRGIINSSAFDTVNGEYAVTTYQGTANMPAPDTGTKTAYYMSIKNSKRGYYLSLQ